MDNTQVRAQTKPNRVTHEFIKPIPSRPAKDWGGKELPIYLPLLKGNSKPLSRQPVHPCSFLGGILHSGPLICTATGKPKAHHILGCPIPSSVETPPLNALFPFCPHKGTIWRRALYYGHHTSPVWALSKFGKLIQQL